MKAIRLPHRLKQRMRIWRHRQQRHNRKIAEIVHLVASVARVVVTEIIAATTVVNAAKVVAMSRPVKAIAQRRQHKRR
jgi:hypothetical protein